MLKTEKQRESRQSKMSSLSSPAAAQRRPREHEDRVEAKVERASKQDLLSWSGSGGTRQDPQQREEAHAEHGLAAAASEGFVRGPVPGRRGT